MTSLSRPSFLDIMDSDPTRAFELFYRFAYRELTTIAPRPMRAMNPEDQQDLLQEVILHCTRDDFSVMRRYNDIGKSFGSWLYRVAHNLSIEHLRRKNREWQIIAEPGTSTDSNVIENLSANSESGADREHDLTDVISKVRNALESIGQKCRLLIEMAADEFSPKEMAGVLGLGFGGNKKVSDDLKYCRKKLRNILATRGLAIEEFF